jgi:hypothetical protein
MAKGGGGCIDIESADGGDVVGGRTGKLSGLIIRASLQVDVVTTHLAAEL